MKRFILFLVCTTIIFFVPVQVRAAYYSIQKIGDGVYGAIALPEGKAASNAMIVVTNYQVILVGAHFLPEGVRELVAEIVKITPLPIRHVILTHHHQGFNYIDFDLPANAEIITSWQTWQALKNELRPFKNQVIIFDSQLTLQRDNISLVLNNTVSGHSDGDVIVYVPSEGVLFASDLLFNDAVGYMGDGHMRDWVLNLDMMEQLNPRVVIPGVGKVTDAEGIARFRTTMRAFLTEVLQNIEKGYTLAQTKKAFSLPEYQSLPGFKVFFDVNLERAYKELKEDYSVPPSSRAH